MVIEISDSILKKAKLQPEALKLRLALMLFKEELITLGQAAEIAGLHQMQFQKELAKRKIPIHYGEEDFERDLITISKMKL
jgi:predicted HTH domain antitoxin